MGAEWKKKERKRARVLSFGCSVKNPRWSTLTPGPILTAQFPKIEPRNPICLTLTVEASAIPFHCEASHRWLPKAIAVSCQSGALLKTHDNLSNRSAGKMSLRRSVEFSSSPPGPHLTLKGPITKHNIKNKKAGVGFASIVVFIVKCVHHIANTAPSGRAIASDYAHDKKKKRT